MRILLLVIISTLIASFVHVSVLSEDGQTANTLPADLIIQGVLPDQYSSVLLRIDATTKAISPFYSEVSDDGIRMSPLRWSPDGRYLAILKVRITDGGDHSIERQICILTRDGQLKTCFDETPSEVNVRGFPVQLYATTWSDDSRYIIFAARNEKSSYIVEGDILTKNITHTIYSYADSSNPENIPALLFWSPALDTILVNIGNDPSESGNLLPHYILTAPFNLATKIDVTAFIDKDFPLSAFCPFMSPRGTYLVGSIHRSTAVLEQVNTLFLMNTTGEIISTVVGDDIVYGNLAKDCPLWTKDESKLMFMGAFQQRYEQFIFEFSLRTDQLRVVYRSGLLSNQPGSEVVIKRIREIYQNSNYVAVETNDNPNPVERVAAAVLFPDGHVESFLGEYDATSAPIWVPPLQTEGAAITPVSTSPS